MHLNRPNSSDAPAMFSGFQLPKIITASARKPKPATPYSNRNVYTGFSFLKAMNLPSSLYNMLPYIISLIVLAFTSKNSRAPKAEGIPYDKGMR